MIIGSRQQLAKIRVDSISVGDAMIKPVTSLRNLGVWFDQHMTMSDHIGKVCSKAFYSLYNVRHIGKCLTDEVCKTLVYAFVVCHLDYCNALLHDVSQYQQQSVQRVLNAVARRYTVYQYYHISPVLKEKTHLPSQFTQVSMHNIIY